MIPISLIQDKIERIQMEIKSEKSLKNKELLEERILVLEELLVEALNQDSLGKN